LRFVTSRTQVAMRNLKSRGSEEDA
jgi:hypothetical protein